MLEYVELLAGHERFERSSLHHPYVHLVQNVYGPNARVVRGLQVDTEVVNIVIMLSSHETP